jgi:beta propeller repeat protein
MRIALLWVALAMLVGCQTIEPRALAHPRELPRVTPASRLSGKIVFVSERDGNSEIYALDLGDHRTARVTTRAGGDYPTPPSTQGQLATIESDGEIERLALPGGAALLEAKRVRNPVWLGEDALVVESDRHGFRDLFRVGVDGHVERLTDDKGGSFDPSVHGDRVVYAASREGDTDIYALDLRTRATERLSWSRGVDMAPRFSPDGKRIAYVSHRGHTPLIYVMQSDGSHPRALMARGKGVLEQAEPCWSPDASAIAFVERSQGRAAIVVVSSDDGRVIGRSDAAASRTPIDQMPAWSPDGRHLAFVSSRDDNQEIYAMHRDGSDVTRLTNDGADDWLPRWIAD